MMSETAAEADQRVLYTHRTEQYNVCLSAVKRTSRRSEPYRFAPRCRKLQADLVDLQSLQDRHNSADSRWSVDTALRTQGSKFCTLRITFTPSSDSAMAPISLASFIEKVGNAMAAKSINKYT